MCKINHIKNSHLTPFRPDLDADGRLESIVKGARNTGNDITFADLIGLAPEKASFIQDAAEAGLKNCSEYGSGYVFEVEENES